VQEVGAGYVVPTGDKEALSDAIFKMLSLSEAQRKEMGKCGRQLVMRKYTQDLMARKMLTVYQRILAYKPVPLYPEPANVYEYDM
jgi:glycosyltransferase involved in cell wall biosynthesis